MESSDDFAYSGPKMMTLQLLPLSRREVLYLLVPFIQGDFVRMNLMVTDTYFNKVLRLLPTGSMYTDGGKLALWIDAVD